VQPKKRERKKEGNKIAFFTGILRLKEIFSIGKTILFKFNKN
jgi:hypothetical protein